MCGEGGDKFEACWAAVVRGLGWPVFVPFRRSCVPEILLAVFAGVGRALTFFFLLPLLAWAAQLTWLSRLLVRAAWTDARGVGSGANWIYFFEIWVSVGGEAGRGGDGGSEWRSW